jgi:hypothetical protein
MSNRYLESLDAITCSLGDNDCLDENVIAAIEIVRQSVIRQQEYCTCCDKTYEDFQAMTDDCQPTALPNHCIVCNECRVKYFKPEATEGELTSADIKPEYIAYGDLTTRPMFLGKPIS